MFAAALQHMQWAGRVSAPAFRRLPMELQLEMAGNTDLSEAELAAARTAAAAAAGLSGPEDLAADSPALQEAVQAAKERATRRAAAARLLQARLPPLLKALHARRAAAQKRQADQGWLAHACIAQAQAALRRASTCAAAGSSDNVKNEVLAQPLQGLARACVFARRASDCALVSAAVAQAWDAMRLLVPDPDGTQQTAQKAQWAQRAADADATTQLLWSCEATPPSPARSLVVIVGAAVDLAGALHDGTAQPDSLAWLTSAVLGMCTALHAMHRPHAAYTFCQQWQHVTRGAHSTRVLPQLITLAEHAGISTEQAERDLKQAQREVSSVISQLQAARAAAQHALGIMPWYVPQGAAGARDATAEDAVGRTTTSTIVGQGKQAEQIMVCIS